MARPIDKAELLDLSKKNFDALLRLIESLPEEEQKADFPTGTMNRNIRDVLMHLHHWHLMMEEWYNAGMNGNKPEIPAKGYTWKTTPELNKWIWEKYKSTPLEDAKMSFKSSHDLMTQLIAKHSDEELFEKKRYEWTGTTSLGAYFISSTSSHYDWAIRLIKKVKK